MFVLPHQGCLLVAAVASYCNHVFVCLISTNMLPWVSELDVLVCMHSEVDAVCDHHVDVNDGVRFSSVPGGHLVGHEVHLGSA